ncbi:hypothetical protein J22TS1_48530 [Siminovitchia terrae]|nr:hypothetical protein [Siminovitchia terrae]GIN93802.1 hypothetical protein J22TS1_48530 [Siminovitchia terrae]
MYKVDLKKLIAFLGSKGKSGNPQAFLKMEPIPGKQIVFQKHKYEERW